VWRERIAIRDADRALYHAAASMASNYLVTLESTAASLAGQVGVSRELPRTACPGDARALAGPRPTTRSPAPIARGDEMTVQRQRAALAARAPELLDLWERAGSPHQGLAEETKSA